MSDLFYRVSSIPEDLLGVSQEKIIKVLEDEGISNDGVGITVLDSPTTTIDVLVDILKKAAPESKLIRLKTAANILKKSSPSIESEKIKESNVVISSPEVTFFVDAVKSLRPIQQWSDKELIESFIATRSVESVEELDRRAKHQKFIVLKDPSLKNLKKYEPGKEEIDLDMSLKLLRDTRKQTIPGFLPVEGGVRVVYRITDLNLEDRMVELCPICSEALFKGYCEHDMAIFTDIGDDERAYIKLIVQTGKFAINSSVERKALIATASKGVEELKAIWPCVSQQFDELKLIGCLPKLRIISSRPNSVADPYFQNGNRSFGHKVF